MTIFASEDIIGEEWITEGAVFAERMLAEGERMWASSGWKTETDQNGILVESKPVAGVFAAAGILVTRSAGEVAAPARDTFDMLISPAGFSVIDPISKPEDHRVPPLQIYPWRVGSRLEAALATTRLPFLALREFVVLNAMDPTAGVFASKSILHHSCPGGSRYSQQAPPPGRRVRAVNTFAIKVLPVSSQSCRILCINYADMAGSTPAGVNNLINTRFFLPPLYQRITRVMKTHASIPAGRFQR